MPLFVLDILFLKWKEKSGKTSCWNNFILAFSLPGLWAREHLR